MKVFWFVISILAAIYFGYKFFALAPDWAIFGVLASWAVHFAMSSLVDDDEPEKQEKKLRGLLREVVNDAVSSSLYELDRSNRRRREQEWDSEPTASKGYR